MKIPKPSDADEQRFYDLAPDAPGVKRPDDERATLLAQPGSGPFGPEERPMGGDATLPSGWSTRKAAGWMGKAPAHVAPLPPKATKKRATRTATTTRPT